MRVLLKAVLVAAAGAAALSGCMRFTADLDVSADDTVSGEYVVAVEEGAGAAVGMDDRALAEDLWGDSGLAATLDAPRQHEYTRDGYVGIEVDFRDQPLAAFAPSSDRFGIVRDGDEFVVSGPASAAEADDADFADADMWIAMTFPGDVVEANGEVDGRTVRWNLVGGPDELYARASATPGPPPASAFIATAVVVLAVAAFLYARVGSSSRAPSAGRPLAPARGSVAAGHPRDARGHRPEPPRAGAPAPSRRPQPPRAPTPGRRPPAPPRRHRP